MFKLIRKTLGCLVTLVACCIILVTVGLFFSLRFAPKIIETAIEETTGFNADIAHMEISPFGGRIEIQDFEVENPTGWPDKRFVHLRMAKIDMDPASLWGERLIINEVVVDLDHVAYVVNEQGVKNALEFAKAFESEKKEEEAEPVEKGEPVQFLIKKLTFKLDNVEWLVHSGSRPSEKHFEPKIEMVFTDVDEVEDVVGPLKRELMNAGLGIIVTGLLQDLVDVGAYADIAGNVLSGSFDAGGEVLNVGGEALGEAAKGLQEGAGTATEGIQEAGKKIKGLLGGLKKEEE